MWWLWIWFPSPRYPLQLCTEIWILIKYSHHGPFTKPSCVVLTTFVKQPFSGHHNHMIGSKMKSITSWTLYFNRIFPWKSTFMNQLAILLTFSKIWTDSSGKILERSIKMYDQLSCFGPYFRHNNHLSRSGPAQNYKDVCSDRTVSENMKDLTLS